MQTYRPPLRQDPLRCFKVTRDPLGHFYLLQSLPSYTYAKDQRLCKYVIQKTIKSTPVQTLSVRSPSWGLLHPPVLSWEPSQTQEDATYCWFQSINPIILILRNDLSIRGHIAGSKTTKPHHTCHGCQMGSEICLSFILFLSFHYFLLISDIVT